LSAHYFISDAHLGTGFLSAEQRLLQFLETIQGKADTLYILGDLFEFWFEYQRVVPKHGVRVLGRLADLRRAGTRVVYLRGNHDFWLKGFLEQELGVAAAGDELLTTIDGRQVYLAHGDAVDTGLVPRLFRRLVRSRLNGMFYSFIHPDIGMGLARWVARQSRDLGAKLYLEAALARFATRMIAAGVEIVILGHSHVPEERLIGNGVYLNIGDWISHFTYGVIRDGIPRLERF